MYAMTEVEIERTLADVSEQDRRAILSDIHKGLYADQHQAPTIVALLAWEARQATWTVYGVYLRRTPRCKWDLNMIDKDVDRCRELGKRWVAQAHDPTWQWAIKQIETANPVNWGDQLGWRLDASALTAGEITVGVPTKDGEA